MLAPPELNSIRLYKPTGLEDYSGAKALEFHGNKM
jgi:hypothetical protein